MIKEFEKLNTQEKEMLLKAPAYVSLLAANADGDMDESEKKAAIKFSHIKTFSSHPMLQEYYKEVENIFTNNIELLDNQLPKGKEERDNAIKSKLACLEVVLQKLGKEYAATLQRSFITYTEHVSRAHKNLFESFIFPINIKGLTE